MTQKEKIIKALQFAQSMRSTAKRIEWEGNDYDMQWHKPYVNEILSGANELIAILTDKKKNPSKTSSRPVKRTVK